MTVRIGQGLLDPRDLDRVAGIVLHAGVGAVDDHAWAVADVSVPGNDVVLGRGTDDRNATARNRVVDDADIAEIVAVPVAVGNDEDRGNFVSVPGPLGRTSLPSTSKPSMPAVRKMLR